MEIKILQVFLGADGLPYKDQERTVHFPIVGSGFQGASNTTKIRFYYDELVEQDDTETAWVACAKLPNGKIGSKVLETDYDSTLGEHYALLELDSFYFQYKGDVYISLQGYQGGVQVSYDEETELYTINGTPTIASTGSIKLSVNYATQFVGSGETSNVNFQRILADLGTKLGIRAQSEHVEELPTVGQNDIFYVFNDDPNNQNLQNIYIWNENTQSYVWVGDNTLYLGEYYTKEQGNQFEEGIDNRVSSVENELSSVAQGSPKGVYATLAALQAAYPTGTTGIYVVSADGHWYYWSGSAWTDGGTYQASEIGINEIALEQLERDISDNFESINWFDRTKIVRGGYFNAAGVINPNAGSYYSTQYIPVKQGVSYQAYPYPNLLEIATYDKDGNFLARVDQNNSVWNFNDNVAYIRLSIFNHVFENTFMFCEESKFPSYPSGYVDYKLETANINTKNITDFYNEVVSKVGDANLVTAITKSIYPIYSTVYNGYYIGGGGELIALSTYNTIIIPILYDIDIWLDTYSASNADIMLGVYKNQTSSSSNFIHRYRTGTDMPSSSSKLSLKAGQMISISFDGNTTSYSFSIDGMMPLSYSFKTQYLLNENQIKQVADRIKVNKNGDNFDIIMGKYRFEYHKYNSSSINLNGYDLYEIFVNESNTSLEYGNILGVIYQTGEGNYMGGVNHGNEEMISMNIYCDGAPVTQNTYGKKVDIYYVANLKNVTDGTTNVVKKFIHISFENNTMTIETTFKILISSFSCSQAYIGMWGQKASSISALYNNIVEYDVSNPQVFSNVKNLKYCCFVFNEGSATISCDDANDYNEIYYYAPPDGRIKLYFCISKNQTYNQNDTIYGKAVYKFS